MRTSWQERTIYTRVLVQHVLIALVAFVAAGVTFFSGFGLGTALLPVFALFFPAEVAVAATAIVHLVNNLLKLVLLRLDVARDVVLRFGFPAVIAALAGALLLDRLSELDPLTSYRLAGHAFAVRPLNVVIAVLLLFAGVQELSRRLERFSLGRRALPIGGLVSGFLGGLAGLQGAVRSAFLIRIGLGAKEFIATGVAVGLLVDVVRVGVYGSAGALAGGPAGLVVAGVAGATIGTLIANRFLQRVTITWIRTLVGAMLIALALALGAGLI